MAALALALAIVAAVAFFGLKFLDVVLSGQIAFYDIGTSVWGYTERHQTFPSVLTSERSPRYEVSDVLIYYGLHDREIASLRANPAEFETKFGEWVPAIERAFDERFYYVGYAVTNVSQAEAFRKSYLEHRRDGRAMSGDIEVAEGSGNLGSSTLFQLRRGLSEHVEARLSIDRDVVDEELGSIIWLIERPESFRRDFVTVGISSGGDVRKMASRRRGEWPYVPEYLEILQSLELSDEEQ